MDYQLYGVMQISQVCQTYEWKEVIKTGVPEISPTPTRCNVSYFTSAVFKRVFHWSPQSAAALCDLCNVLSTFLSLALPSYVTHLRSI